ncbi:hypothetical protein Taro_021274 [Colocasia esculenta]|uniref:Uncharacterized protein n=1 Tax=Colocasia esculenta TaxID=4460 RepID=A0A843V0W4_COLES|nr:hypothetical protein [Colocasia esculenta]
MWLLGVSCGDTWLFLPDLVEVWNVGAYVVRLWSHVVAPVFRELIVSASACRELLPHCEEACCMPSSSAFRGLLGVAVLCHGFWCRVAHRGDLPGEGPFPLSCLEVELVALLVRVVSLWAIGRGDLLCHLLLCWFLVAWLDDVGQRALYSICALEVLVAVWCVALSACVVGAVPCVCVLLRADVVVALLKLLIFVRFSCGSLVESPLRLALCRFSRWCNCVASCLVLVLVVAPCTRARVVCFVLFGALVYYVVPWLTPGVFVGTVCCVVHAESCFRIVFDSAGSTRVVFHPTLVVGRGITQFRCFVVLCSRCFPTLLLSRVVLLPLSLEFLLLWLVRNWLSLLSLVREAHPLLSSDRDSLSQEFVAGWSWWWFVRRALPAV